MKHKLMTTSRNTIDYLSYYYELQRCQKGCFIISRRFFMVSFTDQAVSCSPMQFLYIIFYMVYPLGPTLNSDNIGIREADLCHTLHQKLEACSIEDTTRATLPFNWHLPPKQRDAKLTQSVVNLLEDSPSP